MCASRYFNTTLGNHETKNGKQKMRRNYSCLTTWFVCVSDHLRLALRACIKSPLLQSTSSLLALARNVLRNPSKNGSFTLEGLGVLGSFEMQSLLVSRNLSWVAAKFGISSITGQSSSEKWSLFPGSLMLLLSLEPHSGLH